MIQRSILPYRLLQPKTWVRPIDLCHVPCVAVGSLEFVDRAHCHGNGNAEVIRHVARWQSRPELAMSVGFCSMRHFSVQLHTHSTLTSCIVSPSVIILSSVGLVRSGCWAFTLWTTGIQTFIHNALRKFILNSCVASEAEAALISSLQLGLLQL